MQIKSLYKVQRLDVETVIITEHNTSKKIRYPMS